MRRSKPKLDNQALIAILSAAILGVSVVIFFVLGQRDKDQDTEPPQVELIATQAVTLPAGGTFGAVDLARDESLENEAEAEGESEADEASETAEETITREPPSAEVAEERAPKHPENVSKSNRARPDRSARASKSIERASKSIVAPVIVPEAPKKKIVTTLTITSVPRGATIALDGIFIGKAPITRIVIAPGRHTVAASFVGYEPKLAKFNTSEGEIETVSLQMKKIVEKVAAPAVGAVAPAKVERSARTPRVAASKDGNVGSGRSAINGSCNSCHAREGAPRVSSKRFTRSQWDRFFAAGSHDRYQRLGGKVSSAQLANVKAYLKSKSADAARNQGAGIR